MRLVNYLKIAPVIISAAFMSACENNNCENNNVDLVQQTVEERALHAVVDAFTKTIGFDSRIISVLERLASESDDKDLSIQALREEIDRLKNRKTLSHFGVLDQDLLAEAAEDYLRERYTNVSMTPEGYDLWLKKRVGKIINEINKIENERGSIKEACYKGREEIKTECVPHYYPLSLS